MTLYLFQEPVNSALLFFPSGKRNLDAHHWPSVRIKLFQETQKNSHLRIEEDSLIS